MGVQNLTGTKGIQDPLKKIESQFQSMIESQAKTASMMEQLTEMVVKKCVGEAGVKASGGMPQSFGEYIDIFLKPTHKLESPFFNGSNVQDWLKSIEDYFKLCKVPKNLRVDIASLYMRGEASLWVDDYMRSRESVCWSTFSKAVLARFHAESHTTVIDNLHKPKYSNSCGSDDFKVLPVVDFLQGVVDPMVSVKEVEKAPWESYAEIGGLDAQIQEIKEAVELPSVVDLDEHIDEVDSKMHFVDDIEEHIDKIDSPKSQELETKPLEPNAYCPEIFIGRLESMSKHHVSVQTFPLTPLISAVQYVNQCKPLLTSNSHTEQPNKGNSVVEMSENRKNGLCVHCGGPFSTDHYQKLMEVEFRVIEIIKEGELGNDHVHSVESSEYKHDVEVVFVPSKQCLEGVANPDGIQSVLVLVPAVELDAFYFKELGGLPLEFDWYVPPMSTSMHVSLFHYVDAFEVTNTWVKFLDYREVNSWGKRTLFAVMFGELPCLNDVSLQSPGLSNTKGKKHKVRMIEFYAPTLVHHHHVLKEEVAGVVEPVPSPWTEHTIVSEIAQANALTQISSRAWQIKLTYHQTDSEVIRQSDLPHSLHLRVSDAYDLVSWLDNCRLVDCSITPVTIFDPGGYSVCQDYDLWDRLGQEGYINSDLCKWKATVVADLEGSADGLYVWVVANYALETLGGDPPQPTGIIQLGEVSAEVTLVPSEIMAPEFSTVTTADTLL